MCGSVLRPDDALTAESHRNNTRANPAETTKPKEIHRKETSTKCKRQQRRIERNHNEMRKKQRKAVCLHWCRCPQARRQGIDSDPPLHAQRCRSAPSRSWVAPGDVVSAMSRSFRLMAIVTA